MNVLIYMRKHKLESFGRVDHSGDPDYFIRFLDTASADESFQDYKKLTFRMLDLRPSERVLDVACGTGEDARTMASLVGPGGQVVGVDGSEAMILEARRRSQGKQLPVEFVQGDASKLDFPDDSFDVCRCDRSFMHIPDARQALREMVRAARSGGRILVYEVDFETLTIDAPDRILARKIVNTWTDGFRDGWLGRRILGMFKDLDLRNVTVVPATLYLQSELVRHTMGEETVERAKEVGVISKKEGEAWLAMLEERIAASKLFSTLTGFIVLGRKP